jgi:hypothetical protein
LPNVSFEILETISSIYAFWAAKTVDRPAWTTMGVKDGVL